MPIKPPHLQDEEELAEEQTLNRSFSSIGAQGPSKYGKGGSKLYKAKGRARGRRQ
ncbi:MAG: hypothetical protein PHY14_00640 [Candidatus Gracilibacteria bacterium]|nr:hypothetical protein [Candidatus Gracilibacteria bacterium]